MDELLSDVAIDLLNSLGKKSRYLGKEVVGVPYSLFLSVFITVDDKSFEIFVRSLH
jgi:hypothetical protein